MRIDVISIVLSTCTRGNADVWLQKFVKRLMELEIGVIRILTQAWSHWLALSADPFVISF